MSTYYKTSKPIPFEDIQRRGIAMNLHSVSDEDGKGIFDDDNNYVHLITNERNEVTDLARFAGNRVDYIILKLEEEFNIKIYSEHQKEYGNTQYFGAVMLHKLLLEKDLEETA